MPPPIPLSRIVSGGQTGVDRAALDAALARQFPCGGWCPRGRIAEDGTISDRYPLRETESAEYAERTRLNVRDSNATLILTRGRPSGGTAMTIDFAEELAMPYLVIDLAAKDPDAVARVRAWIETEGIMTLNVAGPRESGAPGIHDEARALLLDLFDPGAVTGKALGR